MRRFVALGIIGLTVIGIAALWLLIPQLTEGDDPTAASSTSSTSATSPPTTAGSASTTTTEPLSVPTGGSAVFGIVGEPLSLNPLLTGGNAAAVEVVTELWTIGLIDIDAKTHDPVPLAAVSIPSLDNGGLTVNEDGTLTLRYELDPEVRWEDGTPVSGHDVAFTYELMVDPALPIRPDLRDLHQLIVPGSVNATDDSVSMLLERPTIRVLSLFPVIVPVEQASEADFAEDWNQTTWMSAGPFRFDSWDTGQSVRFVRNEAYGRVDELGDKLPYLDSVKVAFYPGDDALLAAFRLQAVDAALVAADPALLDEFDLSASIDLQIAAGPEYEHIGFEFGPGRFEANPGSMNESLAFREFVARAIDRPAIVSDVLANRVPVLDTVVGMSWPAASAAAWSAYTVDETVQAELLATAIEDLEPTSATVDFATSTSLERTQIAGALLQRLGAAGLSVDIELLELGEFFRDRVLTGAFDIGEWAWRATPGPVGAVADLEARFSTLPENDGYNFYRWGAEGSAESLVAGDLDSRITALDGILDLEDLRDRLEEIDGLLAENVVIVPMYAVPNAAAVWEASFDGFEHVAAFPDTWNAAFWHRSTG
jgi:peptide/nickel transport system substrate-binding protein